MIPRTHIQTRGVIIAVALFFAHAAALATSPTITRPLGEDVDFVYYNYAFTDLPTVSTEGDGKILKKKDGVILKTGSSFSVSYSVELPISSENAKFCFWLIGDAKSKISLMIDGRVVDKPFSFPGSPYGEDSFPILKELTPGPHTVTVAIESVEEKTVKIKLKEINFLAPKKQIST